MKSKFIVLSALALIVAVSVSGCGLYNVNKTHSKGFINSRSIAGIKDGVSKNYILARFGKPSRKTENKWIYCGKNVKNTGYLYIFNSKKVVNRCAFFTFNNGKLVKTGFKNY